MNNNPNDYNANDFSLENNGNQPYGNFPAPRNNTFGTVSLVCGILAIVLGCCCTYLGVLFGILAVVFGLVDKSKNGSLSGLAIAGIVCGAFGFVLAVVAIVINLINYATGNTPDYIKELEDLLSSMEE